VFGELPPNERNVPLQTASVYPEDMAKQSAAKLQNNCSQNNIVLTQKVTSSGNYEGHLESKERFAIKKIFIDNRKEKEYAGFITHLHLLLHIVTLGSEALVVP
jgi:hypothetical protein